MRKKLCIVVILLIIINISGCSETEKANNNLVFSGVEVEVENEMPCTVESYNDGGVLVEAYKVTRVNISGKENYVTKNNDIFFTFNVEELYSDEGSGYCGLVYQFFDDEGNVYDDSVYASSDNRLYEGEQGIVDSPFGFRDIKDGKYKLKIIERP